MNLATLTKPELVGMTKILQGSAGDYARLSKDHYVELLSRYDSNLLDTALTTYRKEKNMNQPNHAPMTYVLPDVIDVEPKKAIQPAPVIQQPTPESDDLQAAAALLHVLKSSKGIDEAAVRRIVELSVAENNAAVFEQVSLLISNELAKQKPVVHTVVVSPVAEVKIEAPVPPTFKKLVTLAGLRKNILLVGPAGCGKTTVAHLVADALKLPFASISCSAGMSEGQLLGRLLPIGDSGKFEYVESEFVRCYENGGVFLIDELDASDENTLIILNQALANSGFHLPSRPEKPYCKRHPDFVCIAAANTFGHGADMIYAGRNKLDGATLDRFRSGIIVMDYDKDYEASRCEPAVLKWGYEIREKINSLRLRRIMSTRVLADFSDQYRAGLTIKDFEDSYFADWSRDELSKIGR